MKTKLIHLLTLTILVISIGCKEDDEFKENLELKTNLQGTWKRFFEPSLWTQVTFDDYTMSWYDSTVQQGEIQTVRGSCPVKYTFNDGIEYYNPANINLYTFSNTSENNLLWTFTINGERSTIVDYTVVDGVVGPGQSWVTSTPSPGIITSCYIKFRDNRKTVDFCTSSTMLGTSCITYFKVN